MSGPFVDTYAEHDQQHFTYLANNGEIWDVFYCPGCSGNKWQKQKINSGGVTDAPPAASGPFVNVFSGHDQQHFAYLATESEWQEWRDLGCVLLSRLQRRQMAKAEDQRQRRRDRRAAGRFWSIC